MDDTQKDPNALLDTTDCLEAISVFKGWKNMVFTVVLLALLVLQAAFWLVNNGVVGLDEPAAAKTAAIVEMAPVKIAQAAEASVADPNTTAAGSQMPVDVVVENEADSKPAADNGDSSFELNYAFLSSAVDIANAALILAAIIYCLCILFCLKISLVGRLGGINHICRAFFMALIMLVLLIPWQKFFGASVPGAIWYPDELRQWADVDMSNITRAVMYFLRFVGYWLLVFLFLISAQIRSVRWTRSILRRLEVI